ncbi:MAG: hypothetical protein ABSF69_29020 [Polyangiaceae bacterium]
MRAWMVGRIPTPVDSDLVVYETAAIVPHLGDRADAELEHG